jgi:hypothetical protein
MMALELLDTKGAGVIQPDPDSAQAGEVETEHILARPTDRAHRRSGSVSIPRPSSLARSKMSALPRSSAWQPRWGRLSRESRLVVRARKPITMTDPRRLPPPLPDGRAFLSGHECVESNLSRSRFRQAAITETSVHNAVQPV